MTVRKSIDENFHYVAFALASEVYAKAIGEMRSRYYDPELPTWTRISAGRACLDNRQKFAEVTVKLSKAKRNGHTLPVVRKFFKTLQKFVYSTSPFLSNNGSSFSREKAVYIGVLQTANKVLEALIEGKKNVNKKPKNYTGISRLSKGDEETVDYFKCSEQDPIVYLGSLMNVLVPAEHPLREDVERSMRDILCLEAKPQPVDEKGLANQTLMSFPAVEPIAKTTAKRPSVIRRKASNNGATNNGPKNGD